MARPIITGDKELMSALTEIPLNVRRHLDTIAVDSLEPMRAQTEVNARQRRQVGRRPRGGHLDEGIVVKKMKSSAQMREFWISMKNRARSIAHLVEFGTAPHWQPIRKVMHPGARAKPFMSPAFMSTKQEVVNTFGRATWNVIRATAGKFKGPRR